MATRGKRKPAHARAKLEQAAAIEAQADRIDALAVRLEALESWRAGISSRLIALAMKQAGGDSLFDAVPTAIAGAVATKPTK